MKPLNDPLKQLSDYKRRKKISDKKKLKELRIYLPKGMNPIFCGKEKIKFVKILNHN